MSTAWLPITEDQQDAWVRGADYGPFVRVRNGETEAIARYFGGDSFDAGDEGDIWVEAHWCDDDGYSRLLFEPTEWTATGPDEGGALMAARLGAMERETLRKLMAWYEAQKRGLAVREADAVLVACQKLAGDFAPYNGPQGFE